jgi:hypothetical protein
MVYETSSVQNSFKYHIEQSISNTFVTYFCYTNYFQILHSIYHKLNEGYNGSIIILTKYFNLISYVYVVLFNF